MRLAEDPPASIEGLLKERECLPGPAERMEAERQVAETRESVGVVFAVGTFAALESLPIERQSLAGPAERFEADRQVIEAREGRGVILVKLCTGGSILS